MTPFALTVIAFVIAVATPAVSVAAGCSTGFLQVGTLGCMQESENTSGKGLDDASVACFNDHGGRIPTLQEFKIALATLTLTDLDAGVKEHAADLDGIDSNYRIKPYPNKLVSIDSGGTADYRCWIPGDATPIVPAGTEWSTVGLVLGLIGAAVAAGWGVSTRPDAIRR